MKKIVRLTESDLTRIIKRVINENMSNNDLYKEITEILWNSNASNEEQISVLKYILNQKEGKGWVTKDKTNPLFTGDLSGLGKLVKRTYRIGMDEDFDINEGDGHSLKKLARRIMLTKFDEVLSEMNSDDFGDEFEYADNFITYMLEDISDYEHYDDLYDYIKDEYGDMIMGNYENYESDYDDDDYDDDYM